jgi:hypothetical protein
MSDSKKNSQESRGKGKKPRLNPDLKNAVEAAYGLGIMEGEKRGIEKGMKRAEEYLEKRIEKVIRANHNLLIEVFRLDWSAPVTGVLVPYAYCEKLCRKMRAKGMTGHASRLRFYMNRANPIDLEEAMAIISEMQEKRQPGDKD